MSPTLATTLTLLGILFLLRQESKMAPNASSALWLPVLWLFLAGSRSVSQWLSLGQPVEINNDNDPIDTLTFLFMIISGLTVLARRRLDYGQLIRNNRWIVIFFVYGLVSIVWSDFPFVAFKRWIKTLGHPIMALIILTDPAPMQALRIVFKRCAYLLLPLSVLFIKYYPEYGRFFDPWTGEGASRGVGLSKNDLGYVCMGLGIFLVWNFLQVRKTPPYPGRFKELGIALVMLWMGLWCLGTANSATSLMTFSLGVGSMLLLGSSLINKRHFTAYVVMTLLTVVLVEWAFDAYEAIVLALGRNPTLTDRTVVWADVLAMQNHPLLGFGFESFWLGERLDILWEKWWWRPNQAHNGYIEIYLHLGLVGVFILGMLLLATFGRISRLMVSDFEMSRLRFAFLLAIIIFNYTEAAFKATHFMWTIFHLIAIDVRDPPPDDRSRPS